MVRELAPVESAATHYFNHSLEQDYVEVFLTIASLRSQADRLADKFLQIGKMR